MTIRKAPKRRAGAEPATAQEPRRAALRGVDTPRKELVRMQLIDIAAELFETRGYANTSLGDIAGALGLGRSAIYHYFASKEEILASLVEIEALKPAGELDALMRDRNLSPADRLRRAIVEGIERRLRQGSRFLTLAHLESQIPKEMQAIYNDGRRRIYHFYVECIAEGVRRGDFYDTDPKVAAFAVIGMANWTSRWYSPSGAMAPELIAGVIADLAIEGLRQPGARTRAPELREAFDRLRAGVDELGRLID